MDKPLHVQNAQPHEQFILSNGRSLKNLHELANALIGMEADVFAHHVTNTKNDFAAWVRGVFSQEQLAIQMESVDSKDDMVKLIHAQLYGTSKKQVSPVKKVTPKKEPKLMKVLKKVPKKAVQKKEVKIEAPKKEVKEPKPAKKTAVSQEVPSEILRRQEEITKKLEQVLEKEREISVREKKILEVEKKIEARLGQPQEEHDFFTKEFIQGIVTGFLLTLIGVLVYIKFVTV